MPAPLLVLLASCLLLSVDPPRPHDPEGRIGVLSTRIAQRPKDPLLRVERGRLLLQVDHPEEALVDFERAARMDPSLASAPLGVAMAQRALGRREAALAAVERGLELAPGRLDAGWLRGRILRESGRPEDAAQQFAAVMPRLPSRDPEHYLELARAWAATGTRGGLDQAAATLERGLAELGTVVGLVEEGIALHRQRRDPVAALALIDRMLGVVRRPEPWLLRRTALLAEAGGAAPAGAGTGLALRTEPPVRAPETGAAASDAAAPLRLPPLPPGEYIVVSAAEWWRYRDDGVDQGTAWRARTFDDSGWSLGQAQFGFGDGDERTLVGYGPDPLNKHTTYYFRHAFPVVDPWTFRSARVRLQCDDGAVVYLNGTEVARSNLPAGAVSHATLAASEVVGEAENEFVTHWIDHTLLLPGTNVLAVEVHLASPDSEDMSFDLQMRLGFDPVLVTRGPYLQNLTPTSAVVRWRTDIPAETVLWTGPAPGSLTVAHTDAVRKNEHVVTLTGLTPETRYHYAIGETAGILAGNDQHHWFTTLPPAGANRPVRIWALGDSGTGTAAQFAVRDAYAAFTGSRGTDVMLLLGDNAYYSGTDFEYQVGMFDPYRTFLRNTCVWPTLGNHDALSAASATQSGPYYDVFTLPTAGEAGGLPSGTEAYYSFDRGHVHLICLDSQDSDRAATGAMMTWLQADLANSAARWNVVFFHHPPYSKGSHDSDDPLNSGGRLKDMREIALPILEAGGIDLVLTGHSHNYERSFLLDGHYDVSSTLTQGMVLDRGNGREQGDGAYAKPSVGRAPHEGAVYVVAGSAGSVAPAPVNHPAMFVGFNTLGSLVLDVDGDRLDAWFVTATGTVDDHFTLLKGERRTLTRDVPGISLTTGGAQGLRLQAGAEHAGRGYLLAGSFGTTPGIAFQGLHIPLNWDGWFSTSLGAANTATYPGSLGVLDVQGNATSAFVLPPLNLPGLVGASLFHAYVVFDQGGLVMASNAVKVTLLP